MATLLLITKVLSRKTKQNYCRPCFLFCIAASDLAMEEIEEESCKAKVREKLAVERERINFFGFKNKYGMYKIRDNKSNQLEY